MSCVYLLHVCVVKFTVAYTTETFDLPMHWDIRTHIKSYLIVDPMLVDTQQLIYYGSELTYH